MKNIDAFKAHGDIIWNIANLLRGPYRPPQYRRVMIPLTVLRRLDCVLEASKDAVIKHHKQLKEQTDKDGKPKYDAETIEKMVFHKFKLAFFNTSEFTFQSLLGDPDKLAANLANYMAGFSSRARKIIEKFKFEEEIEKLEEANRLFDVIKQVAAVDLHPDTIPNIAMGYLFEDLVRRFNEQANEEAGDHFTPREVIKLMVNLLFTHDDLVYRKAKLIKIYDPTCGTGGMLSESEKVIKDPETGLNPSAEVRLFGQEYNPESFAICGSDLMIKGEEVNNIVFGDTLGTGKPKEGFADGDGHPGEHFHFMLANPPFGVEWKPEKDFVTKEHDTFGFKGRFGPGLPRINDGALLFLLHMISKMQPAPEKGGEGSRIAVVFNGSPLFTGDAGSGESNIRRWIIENDMLEAVIGLPDQLFYNTGIYTYVWIVTNRKAAQRKGRVHLINATDFAWKMKKSLGRLDGAVALTGQGESLAKWLGTGNGSLRLFVRDGTFSSQLLDLAGLNVGSIVIAKLFGSDKEVQLRCAVADFNVQQGIARPRMAKLATTEAVVEATGEINLAQEQLNLRIVPESLKWKFFSLRTPLYVRGSFAKPDVGLEPGPLAARAGAAVAAAVFAPAALALVPLTVPAADDDVNCKQLLTQVRNR